MSGGQGGIGQGALGDIAKQAGSLFGQASGAVRGGNPLAIGGLAALAGALLGGGGSAARGAVGGGVLAVLGSLAYSVLKQRSGGAEPAENLPIGVCEATTPEAEKAADEVAELVVRAMINAAKADGEIDPEEEKNILGKLAEEGSEEEARAFVATEMHKPIDIAGLAQSVGGRADVAIQVYAASLLAIKVDTPAEEVYLRNLASALNLDAKTLAQVHDALGVNPGA
ncbi:MAG: tellurite resistance TerB family protein [Rhodospirillales bacterium]|nr:tellurite resistance TerB family protein [Rhodospirillales bacterium]